MTHNAGALDVRGAFNIIFVLLVVVILCMKYYELMHVSVTMHGYGSEAATLEAATSMSVSPPSH